MRKKTISPTLPTKCQPDDSAPKDLKGLIVEMSGKLDSRLVDLKISGDQCCSAKDSDSLEPIENKEDRIKNLCKVPQGFGWSRSFNTLERNMVLYTVTHILNRYGVMIREASSLDMVAESTSIQTGFAETSMVYKDFVAVLKIDENLFELMGYQVKDVYILGCAAKSAGKVEKFEKMFDEMIERNNFYLGKSLRIGNNFVEFMKTPSLKMEDVVLSDKIKNEYSLNVIKFLTNPKLQEITLRRGILLYGPPGTGKTSSVRAMFNSLNRLGVTSVFLTKEAIDHNRLTEIFVFTSKYLSPCLIVIEDLDTVVPDRDISVSAFISTFLNLLNGIEDQTKPIVILGTTNKVNILDAAVTRPCRFDRKILIDFPSEEELGQIFFKASGIKPPNGVIRQPKDEKKKLSGAHIEEIVNTAKMLSVDRGVSVESCIEEAVKIVTEDFVIIHPSDKRTDVGFGAQLVSTISECSPPSHHWPSPSTAS